MADPLTRRRFLDLAGRFALAGYGWALHAAEQTAPLLRRIKTATLGAADLAGAEDLYSNWLGYSVAERGTVSPELATSWGAPASAGRRFLLLQPASGVDVFVRAVEIDAVPDYQPMATLGWNAVEIIVDDVYKLYDETLKNSPHEILGEPHSLGGSIASVHAMQLVGPAREVVYLTCETGNREASTLPIPGSFVDRPFIMVLAGRDLAAMEMYYGEKFALPNGGRFSMPVRSIARALDFPLDHIFSLSLLRCAERGNSIELDGYPSDARSRPRREGQLPPGVAMTSFTVHSLDELDVPFITAPARHYGAARAATFIGPAGELVELIEEPA